jgi:hypothetical protein
MILEGTPPAETATPATSKKPRAPRAPKSEPAPQPVETQRIGIELPDGVALEIDQLCAENKFFQRTEVRRVIREEARKAAEKAVLGQVKNIMRALAFGEGTGA